MQHWPVSTVVLVNADLCLPPWFFSHSLLPPIYNCSIRDDEESLVGDLPRGVRLQHATELLWFSYPLLLYVSGEMLSGDTNVRTTPDER